MPPPPGCSLGSYPCITLYWPSHSQALVIQVCLCITSLCVLFSATPSQVAYTSFCLISTQSSSHGLESAYSYLFSTTYLPLVFGYAPENQSRPASRTRVDTQLTLNKQLWNEKKGCSSPWVWRSLVTRLAPSTTSFGEEVIWMSEGFTREALEPSEKHEW